MEQTPTIVIMGARIRSSNRGVLALGTSLTGLCLEAWPGAQIRYLLCHDRSETVTIDTGRAAVPVEIVHCRVSPRAPLRDQLGWIVLMSLVYRCLPLAGLRGAIKRRSPWIRTIAEAAFVGDVRGGDSFSDIYGMERFMRGFLMAWSVILVRGTLVQFPQTYGPYSRKVARALARFLLRRSSVVVARDKASRKVAQDLLGSRAEVMLSPDVAFSLTPALPDPIAIDGGERPASSAPAGLVGINVNGLMFNGGYTGRNMFGLSMDYSRFLPELVEAVLAETKHDVWLVPHTFEPSGNPESDPEACARVRDVLPAALRERVHLVTSEYDERRIKGVIGRCDFFVGSRMHSCIAALSQGIPCVGVAYSMKFQGVFESVGVGDWVVDGRTTTNEAAIRRILELYRQRDAVRGELARQAEAARTRLRDVFSNLVATAGARR